MDKLSIANTRLKTARDNHEQEYETQLKKLDIKQTSLTERLNELNDKKREVANVNGDEDATDEDLVEVNAGGNIIAAKRSTLTQLNGTRLEALFSGRWDKKLQRDSNGRIFLDVNSVCFQAIVDYLNEMTISPEDNPPALPSVDDEHKHILKHQLELFGLLSKVPVAEFPDSNIIKDEGHATQLHDWLNEDGSGGKFSLLYRSSRDGPSDAHFHSKCDNQGCTLTVIETTDGLVLGGYSNTPWTSSGSYYVANKAFLFVLSGSDISAPCKMKLKNANDVNAVRHHPSRCPTFGEKNDLRVNRSNVTLNFGHSYERHSSWPLQFGQGSYTIKEMEVFQVIPGVSITANQEPTPNTKMSKVSPVESFSKEVNTAVNAQWASLQEAEEELLSLEDSFKDEGSFISFFASGQPQDVITLNVCGTIMVTRLQTLQLCKESALASKFSSEEQEKHTPDRKIIKEWNHEDVVAWLNQVEGISESVVKEFDDNQVTGRELLALGAEGLKDFGVTRKGTIYLLLDEIKKLEKAGHDSVILVEHSPYCFQKILDHLRLEGPFMKGLVKTKHGLPVIRDGEKGRYQKVLKHLFPGESSKIFQGDCGSDTQIIDDFGGSSNDGNSVDYESV
mmetsp:Transcript_14090/g.25676  ORF Transcript_14090/g.25676 Transcript_14090/m.25676 type:complete len:619 (+) Transcript_14090:91-1947(+)